MGQYLAKCLCAFLEPYENIKIKNLTMCLDYLEVGQPFRIGNVPLSQSLSKG